MSKFLPRVLSVAAGALALCSPSLITASPPVASESFRIGTEGALCEAQGVMLGNDRSTLFDRKWALICSDVDRPVGTAYSWKGSPAVAERLGRGRDIALDCDEAQGSAEANVRRCRERGTNLEWISYAVRANGWLHVVEGLAAFDSALRLTMANLVEDRIVPGTLDIATIGGTGSLAQARATLGGGDQLIGQGYRRNNAGEYTEAEEFFRPDLIASDNNDEATLAERRHEATVNRALQLSNLGRYDEATRAFAQARAIGLLDPIQARLLRNLEAIDALNRGDLANVAPILARPVPEVTDRPEDSDGSLNIDRMLAAGMNSGLTAGLTDALGQDTRLSRAERATIIDAQARQIGASALRRQGRAEDALAELATARRTILDVKQGRVLTVARLEAQILSEMALAQEARGRYAEAGSLLREAVTLTEQRYPESASVEAARARLAAYLARRGDRNESLALYREVVGQVIGRRAGLVGIENQMKPYFTMLVEDLPQQPQLVNDLFLAAQLIERPGAAQTLAQLARQLSAGSSDASELFRRANAVDRELTRVNLSIAQAQADTPETALLPELRDRRGRLETAQIELLDALSAYPEYRALAHNYLTAEEMRALLKPGEGYLKLIRLGGEMYAVYIAPDRSTGWKVNASSQQVADLVGALRDSISLSIGGVNATYPFDVDSARALHDALFGPVAADIARLDHLVFEPDGALLQLPVNLLIADQASVDAYHSRVNAGGDEFDFRGVRWLGRDTAVSTALSPASFRDARRAPGSTAGRAYIGLGRNEPVGPVTSAALTRRVSGSVEDDCLLPLSAWNQPIPDDELQLAAQLFGADNSSLLTGAAFTDDAIERRQDLSSYRIVHFATHGLVTAPRPGCPTRPALLTSFGGAGSDGLLEFAEVFDLDLDADLVILSACDTASLAGLDATRAAGLESGGGQALDGLVRAFIGAGGRQVIASHWPAPEEYGATRRLFSSFFESTPGTSQAQALRQAQAQLMNDAETSHPFYWSGFALIGDGERSLFNGS
ncbi:MAG TPA: CHAT domain-containing protein [Croceibacterium sp.]|nr:CHAT domain-containing protein [Croceibacterium sp.]